MNVAYSVILKRYAIVDIIVIAIGFVLRVLAGGIATEIWVSEWLVLMTFLLAILLALTKRYDDFSVYEHTGTKPRISITGYNKVFINQSTAIIGSITMVCYIMYTVSPEVTSNFKTDHLYLTSAFVLVGLLRYIQIAVVDEKSGDPTKIILRDRSTQLIVLAWILSFLVIIYL